MAGAVTFSIVTPSAALAASGLAATSVSITTTEAASRVRMRATTRTEPALTSSSMSSGETPKKAASE